MQISLKDTYPGRHTTKQLKYKRHLGWLAKLRLSFHHLKIHILQNNKINETLKPASTFNSSKQTISIVFLEARCWQFKATFHVWTKCRSQTVWTATMQLISARIGRRLTSASFLSTSGGQTVGTAPKFRPMAIVEWPREMSFRGSFTRKTVFAIFTSRTWNQIFRYAQGD